MSDEHSAIPADTAAEHHDTHVAAAGSGHDDDHGTGHEHDGEVLGPVDLLAWLYGLAGVVLGGVVAIVFIISTGRF
jgi:hypothetical protein